MSGRALVAAQPVAVLTVETPAGPVTAVQTVQGAALTAIAQQGPAGRDGPALVPPFHQIQPAAVWTIPHGAGRFPSVTLVDTAGDLFGGAVRYADSNTVIVTLSAPTAGVAYLN